MCTSRAVPGFTGTDESERSELSVPLVHLPQVRPPSLWSGSICHLPPTLRGSANEDGVGINYRPDSTFSFRLTGILVNRTGSPRRTLFHLTSVFQRWFSKNRAPLTGAPTVRRLKTYSAQSGYVYQYFYEGHRPVSAATEYVFSVSPDRKEWHPVSVEVAQQAVDAWQQIHGRELSANECYAVAKMALFQAFDERSHPGLMKQDIRVRAADIEAILEGLGID